MLKKKFTTVVFYLQVLMHSLFTFESHIDCVFYGQSKVIEVLTITIFCHLKISHFEGVTTFLKGSGYQKGGGKNEKEGVRKVLPTMFISIIGPVRFTQYTVQVFFRSCRCSEVHSDSSALLSSFSTTGPLRFKRYSLFILYQRSTQVQAFFSLFVHIFIFFVHYYSRSGLCQFRILLGFIEIMPVCLLGAQMVGISNSLCEPVTCLNIAH